MGSHPILIAFALSGQELKHTFGKGYSPSLLSSCKPVGFRRSLLSSTVILDSARSVGQILDSARSVGQMLDSARSVGQMLDSARSVGQILDSARSVGQMLDSARSVGHR